MPPTRLTRTTGLLFVIGSALFALGVPLSLPTALPPLLSATTYAIGAVFFTTAAACQVVLARGGPRSDGVAALVQLVGTVLFNVNTIDAALTIGAHPELQDEAVWVPDTTGSIAFLVSSAIAMAPEVRARRHRHLARPTAPWTIAALNLAGSVFFGISAAAAYVLRDGHDVSLVWANLGTFLGALCFLVAAWMFGFPRPAQGPDPAPARPGEPRIER